MKIDAIWRHGILGLVTAIAFAACSNPKVPMLRNARPEALATPEAELIVIKDEGIGHGVDRKINHLGSIVFLNEANDGPVTVTLGGDFSFRSQGDFPDGTFCLTVRGIRFEVDGARTPVAIPPGGLASTCLGYPGQYSYTVRVGEKVFEGELEVIEAGNPHPKFSEVSGS
ncbi:MAG: hypothetical protein RL885_18640 [Planctomycetota bacterium]